MLASLVVGVVALSAAFLAPLAEAKAVVHDESFVPDAVLRVSFDELNVIACKTRPSVLVNDTTPGPLIRLKENQTTWVRVYNDMKVSNLTIHWHGLSQSVAPFSDGTPRASQWPIAPHHYFDYELRPKIGEAGTYFYHSHVQFQAVTASGPIVVDEASGKPPFDYDEERIFHLTELFHRSDKRIIHGLLASPFVWSGEAKMILANGHAPPAINAGETITCGPEVIEVEPDKTYRFRFIGGMALSEIALGIEDHPDLTIIEADGSYTKPYKIDYIQVASGQRFDVLVRTMSAAELKKAGKSDFWIQMTTQYRPTQVTSYAYLSYKTKASCSDYSCYKPGWALGIPANEGAPPPATGPLKLPRFNNSWLEYALEPLEPNDFPAASEVTRRVYLASVQVELGNDKVPWYVQNHTWVAVPKTGDYMTSPTTTPYLISIYKDGDKAVPSVERATSKGYGGWDPMFNAYPAKIGEVIEIILVNEAGFANTYDTHPWHAHGGHYFDIGSGPGVYDPRENEKKLKNYNPVLRDTTMLYRWPADDEVHDPEYHQSGWRGWRLRVEDAGVWMIHCHTLQHMISGMQTVWIMGNAAQITAGSQPPQSYFNPEAMEGYMTYKGAAYGHATRHAVVNHHFPERET